MEYMKRVIWVILGAVLSFAALLLVLTVGALDVFAEPMTLSWEPVTQNTDGSPAGPVLYRLYKRTATGPYLFHASRIGTSYTWAVPALGEWTFVVRALSKLGESANSNEAKVRVNPCWFEVTQ